jgi:curved DNA-binding protein CbpA
VSRPSFGELGGQDPYEILELPSGASEAEVRAARKRLLRRYHPDLPAGDLRRTQMITAAADLLLDPLRRIGYYDLRDEESRRTVFAATEPPDIWSSRAGPMRVDEPAPPKAERWEPKAEPREAPPSSVTRTDGHWFRPLGGFDGRAPRPQTSPGWSAFQPANGATPTGTGTTGNGANPRGATPNGANPRGAASNGTAGAGPPPNGSAVGSGSVHGIGVPPPAGARPAAPDGFGARPEGFGKPDGSAARPDSSGKPDGLGTRPDGFGKRDGFGGLRRRGFRRRRPSMSGGRWVTRTGHRQDGATAAEPRPGPAQSTAGSTGGSARTTASTTATGQATSRPGIRPTFITPPSQTEKTPPDPAPRHAAVGDQPAAASRWNALAIASVVAILTWTPLPLILGMLALGQIRRYGQRGTRLALAGVVVGAILLVVYFYILVVSR